jgi:ABC-type transport system involved in multi-copper enzyme maturation permease subunit
VALAVLRVRSAHLASAHRTIRQPGFETSLGRLCRFRWNLSDLLPAMVWREIFAQQTIRGVSRNGIIVGCVLDAGFLIYLWVIWFRCWPNKVEMPRDYFVELASMLSVTVGFIYLMICGTRAAGSVTSERESQTWETLLSTTLTGPAIVAGKVLGSMFAMRLLLAHILVFWVMAALLDPNYWTRGLQFVGVLLVVTFPVAVAGVMFSTRSNTTGSAIFLTMTFTMLLLGIHVWVISTVLQFMSIRPPAWINSTSIIWQVFWAAYHDTTQQYGWFRKGLTVSVALSGLAFFAGLGLFLWVWLSLRFDSWVGRNRRVTWKKTAQTSSLQVFQPAALAQ